MLYWSAIVEWLAWSKRHKALRVEVRDTIEAEGGSVEEITIIGFLLKSPFPPINIRPIYLRAASCYPDDSGDWYICGAGGGETYWVWCSDSKAAKVPSSCLREVSVNNGVLALPKWVSVGLYVAFLLAVGALAIGLVAYS